MADNCVSTQFCPENNQICASIEAPCSTCVLTNPNLCKCGNYEKCAFCPDFTDESHICEKCLHDYSGTNCTCKTSLIVGKNCATCNVAGDTCDSCKPGFQGENCDVCADNYINSTTEKSVLQCELCTPNQVSSCTCGTNTTCSTCDVKEVENCFTCKSGDFLTENTPKTCNGCDPACLTCSGAGNANCTACNQNFHPEPASFTAGKTCVADCTSTNCSAAGNFCDLSSKICTKNCAENCKICATSTTCGTCDGDFILAADGTCGKIANCSQMTNLTTCQLCQNGHFLKDNACTLCNATTETACTCGGNISGNCKTCSETENQCTDCFGTMQIESGLCKEPSGTGCTVGSCLAGNYCDTEANQCKTCGDNLNCKTCSGVASCDTCDDNSALVDITARAAGKKCEECKAGTTNCTCGDIKNCSICTAPANSFTGATKCDQCVDGYTGDKCDKCVENYFQTSADGVTPIVCEKCDVSCTSCKGAANECTKCADTHQSSGDEDVSIEKPGTCIEKIVCNISNCKICGSESSCKVCDSNHNINESGSECSICTTIQTTQCTCEGIENCGFCPAAAIKAELTCTNCLNGLTGDKCDKCADGSFKETITGTKTPATTKCSPCNTEIKCKTCINGATCDTCLEGYKKPNDGNTCSDCAEGFYDSTLAGSKAGKTCTPCKSGLNCKTCSNGTACDTCTGNFKLTGSAPNAICKDCIESFAGEKCDGCADNFGPGTTSPDAKNGLSCIDCDGTFPNCKCGKIENCSICFDPAPSKEVTKCFECADGYSGDECLKAKEEKKGLSGGAIAGIVIGVLVVVGGVAGGVFYYMKKVKGGKGASSSSAAMQ